MLVSYHLLFQLTPSEGRICITVFKKNYPKHRKKHNKTRMARNSCHAGAKTHQKFIWGNVLSYFCIIKFVGVTLGNKTIQVSSVQLNKTSSAHCTVCPSPEVSPFRSPFIPPLPTFTTPHPLKMYLVLYLGKMECT